MNQGDISKMQELFQGYGYNPIVTNAAYRVFSLDNGMYPAVEIIPLQELNKEQQNSLKSQYQDMGYAVHICDSCNIEDIDKYLFNGFFRVAISNSRIATKYDAYAKKQLDVFGDPTLQYTYVDIPYSLERNFEVVPTHDSLINSIKSDLAQASPALIIVEAAAGYGKTSTAYEILNTYRDIQKDVRPFLMELSKDRSVTEFRYLLISQIDREFDTSLKSTIVVQNIKNGRIPLIIDGFDELLSKEMDNGASEADFKDVETMLSTIAELLTDTAKVILTTRKTAIFSGDSFLEWYVSHTTSATQFNVSRYQLNSPNITDWLPPHKCRMLPPQISTNLCNPVLLAYLRYIDDSKFSSLIQDETTIISSYFKFLLEREIDRQALPFSVEEQMFLYRRLAALFASFNINSEARENVKSLFIESAYELIQSKETSSRDVNSLLGALATHALLDRKGTGDKLGFINDFVLGTLIANSLVYDDDLMTLLKDIHYSFWEKIITAIEMQNQEFKSKIWKKMQQLCDFTTNPYLQFTAEIRLAGEIDSSYSMLSFDGLQIRNVDFCTNDFVLKNCCFTNYIFEGCIFDFKKIQNSTFINCKFVNCESVNGLNGDCEFYHCSEEDNRMDFSVCAIHNEEMPDLSQRLDYDLRKAILESYFKVDGRTPRMKMVSKLRDEFTSTSKEFQKVFTDLVKNKYIIYSGDKSFISSEGIQLYNTTYRSI